MPLSAPSGLGIGECKVLKSTEPSTNQPLVACVGELVNFLKQYNERRWAFTVEGVLEHFQEGDANAVDEILALYGGMGSLNDLYLCSMNGHSVADRDLKSVNTTLNGLTSRIWQLAQDARKQTIENAKR